MKHLFGFILGVLLVLGCVSCSHDDTPATEELTVSTAYLNGDWSLSEIDGEPLGEGTYLYLSFDRKENTFVMYHNFESMYAYRSTGTWTLSQDEEQGMILTGQYDYDRGEWATYIATATDLNTLRLVNADDASDVRIYTRCTAIPDDVLNGSRAIR